MENGFGLMPPIKEEQQVVFVQPVPLVTQPMFEWHYGPIEGPAALLGAGAGAAPENGVIFPPPPALTVADTVLGMDGPAPLSYSVEPSEYTKAQQIKYLNEIKQVLEYVFKSDTPKVFFVEMGFYYFPPVSWLMKGYTSQDKNGKVRAPFYTTSFRVEKRFGTYKGDLVEEFYVTNYCIEFQCIIYPDGRKKWTSSISSDVYKKKCFHGTFFPPDTSLGLVMELRLMLQTLIVDDFTIQDSAHFPPKSKHYVLLTPFKLVRGAEETLYEKYNFTPTCNPEQFADFRLFLGILFANQLSSATQNRIEAILASKGIEFNPDEYVLSTMNLISLEDEVKESPVQDSLDMPLTLDESMNLSSRVLEEALLLYNIARGYIKGGGNWGGEESPDALQYNSKIPSINLLRYKGGQWISNSIFLNYITIEEIASKGGRRRNARKTRRQRK